MAISNYGELKQTVSKMLDRSDLDGVLDELVRLAESHIFRRLRTPLNEAVVKWSITTPTSSIAIPADYLEARYLSLGNERIERETLSKRTQGKHRSGRVTYTRIARRFMFQPALDDGAELELYYYTDLSGTLVDDADTNDVLSHAPELYLYATLIECEPYLKNDERVGLWQAKYQQAFDAINAHEVRAEFSGQPLQVKGMY